MNSIRAAVTELWDAIQNVTAWLWTTSTRPFRGPFAAANPDANDVWPDDIAEQLAQADRDLAAIRAIWALPTYQRATTEETP